MSKARVSYQIPTKEPPKPRRTPERQRELIFRHYLKKGRILPPDTESDLAPYKEPLRPVDDGYGYMGTLAHNKTGTHVQCHICGYFYPKVGSHASLVHKVTADEYRQRFDLSASTALISKQGREAAISKSLNVSSAEKLRRITMFKHDDRSNRVYRPRRKSLERRNKEGSCPDQLLDKIEKLALKLNRTPTRREFTSEYGHGFLNSILITYGTWNQALSFAGMTPNAYRQGRPRYTRESVIAMIRVFYEQEGRVPRSSDMGSSLIPSTMVIQRLFGGIVAAREAAGFGQHDYVSETSETES